MVPRLALASVGGFAISRESKAYCRAQDESPSHLLKESLAQKNGPQFKKIFIDLSKCGKQQVAADLAADLLLEQESKVLRFPPERDEYEFILKNLKNIYPDIKTHFSKDPLRSKDPMEGLNIHAISSKGQKVIIDSYRRSGVFNEKKVSVSDSFAVFEKNLGNFFQTAQEGQEQLFLVRHRKGAKDLTRHTSPVHIRKKDGVFQFFITDSYGPTFLGGPKKHAIEYVIDAIRKAHRESNSTFPIEINYDAGGPRLGDGSNCVVLSIRDGLEMVRNTDEVYNWIAKKRVKKEDDLYAVSHLPLRMVKNVQSLTYIDRYLGETNQREVALVSEKKLKKETVVETVKRHQYTGPDPKNPHLGKVFNGKIARYYLAYEREIIAKCIKDNSYSETA
jgi:hypothetical protein